MKKKNKAHQFYRLNAILTSKAPLVPGKAVGPLSPTIVVMEWGLSKHSLGVNDLGHYSLFSKTDASLKLPYYALLPI